MTVGEAGSGAVGFHALGRSDGMELGRRGSIRGGMGCMALLCWWLGHGIGVWWTDGFEEGGRGL